LKSNEERVSELLGLLQPKLDTYDLILSKQKYLAGDVRLFFGLLWL
jgi:glutathione S-transferase